MSWLAPWISDDDDDLARHGRHISRKLNDLAIALGYSDMVIHVDPEPLPVARATYRKVSK